MSEEAMCACGKPLHYESEIIHKMVQKLVDELGENIRVTFGIRTWLVPRHYIALHGIDLNQVLERGFPEVTDPFRSQKIKEETLRRKQNVDLSVWSRGR
jgi:hypothetical protein